MGKQCDIKYIVMLALTYVAHKMVTSMGMRLLRHMRVPVLLSARPVRQSESKKKIAEFMVQKRRPIKLLKKNRHIRTSPFH